jgi:hypothetical protein
MFDWHRYLCCCLYVYNDYQMNKVRKIYDECFIDDIDDIDDIYKN